uniref:hypothetical protein n=1 Tax=Stieleria mannarensis TaxID=2755585 RepID=UPI00160281ED
VFFGQKTQEDKRTEDDFRPKPIHVRSIEAGAKLPSFAGFEGGFLHWSDATVQTPAARNPASTPSKVNWVPYRSHHRVEAHFRQNYGPGQATTKLASWTTKDDAKIPVVLVKLYEKQMRSFFADQLDERGNLVSRKPKLTQDGDQFTVSLNSTPYAFTALASKSGIPILKAVRNRYHRAKTAEVFAVVPGTHPTKRRASSSSERAFWAIALVASIGWIVHRRKRGEWLGRIGAELA